MQKIKETALEVVYGVVPITLIMLILQFTPIGLPWGDFVQFLCGTLLLIVGMVLFLLGVEIGFIPMGEAIGSSLVSTGKMRIILIFGFVLGFAVTMPEPDVQVLALQASETSPGIVRMALVLVISLGVGLAVALAMFRLFKGFPVKFIVTVGFGIAFIMLLFCPPDMARLAFDAYGVTTGSLTVPFIMSLGVGVASVTAKRGKSADTFGMLGIASLGAVLATLVMGVIGR